MGSFKRLVVCCDGTWQDSDNGFVRDSWLPWKTSGHLATPTNVTRICRALEPRSKDGIQQIVYYQAGLGSLSNAYSFFVGGYLGQGISENIREAYVFLCNNYEDGDEIILIGFSRGAFTARSIGGLLAEVGLLTKKGLSSFYPVFQDWENQVNPGYEPKVGTTAWPVTRPRFGDPSYISGLLKEGLVRPHVPVKAVAVWDTVGCLGVPDIDVHGVKMYSDAHRELSFVNTEVPGNVEFAYQALALDEEREPYSPTLWESPSKDSPLKLLKQCWFPGTHSSVGGGYSDTSISDITLAWLVTQLSRHLTFDSEYILRQQKQNEQFYVDHKVPVAPWAMGMIQRSDTGTLNTVLGRQSRTPGQYCVIDPMNGKATEKKLTNTCEFIHPCVRYRIQQKGPALVESAKSKSDNSSHYEPKALLDWVYCAPNQPWRDDPALAISKDAGKWDGCGKWMVQRKGSTTYIVEESVEAGTAEIELIQAWPGVEQKVFSTGK